MNVHGIVKKYLRDNGYDGLVQEFSECSCELSDLCPCDNDFGMCEPGYKIPGSMDYDFYITTEKPEQNV